MNGRDYTIKLVDLFILFTERERERERELPSRRHAWPSRAMEFVNLKGAIVTRRRFKLNICI